MFTDPDEIFDFDIDGRKVAADAAWVIERLGADAAAPVIHAAKQEKLLGLIDKNHADLLRSLTGGATIEERDTWQAKELAAEALLIGEADDWQVNMLAAEAGYMEVDPAYLAARVLEKARRFKMLIGVAGGIKSKARAAIKAAADDADLMAAVGEAQQNIAAALAQIAAQS